MKSRPLFYIKILLFVLVIFVFGVYFFHQSKAFLLGPRLEIEEPVNGQTMIDSFLSIKGVASNVATLLINNQEVLVDGFGNFNKNLILARGYNIIELVAKDKFNREVYKKLEVTVK